MHFAEISRREIEGYRLYDFTSSGMSHTAKNWADAINSHRISKANPELNAGLIEIDWDKKALTLSSIGTDGAKVFSHPLSFSDPEMLKEP